MQIPDRVYLIIALLFCMLAVVTYFACRKEVKDKGDKIYKNTDSFFDRAIKRLIMINVLFFASFMESSFNSYYKKRRE